jgi:uncharacterized membrane protein YheB (UPF0754 family)
MQDRRGAGTLRASVPLVCPMLELMLSELRAHPLVYASLPVTAALVGYATNVLALKMMFYPVRFVGIPPFLGWQGIVPRKAGKMAGVAVDTITRHLITVEEMFARIDPQRLAKELERPMVELIAVVTEEVMNKHQPTLWMTLPRPIKQRIIRNLQSEAPAVVQEIMREVRTRIHEVFDLKDLVITSLMRDRELLNRIFLETGRAEFRFIGHSGLYFGFLFGLIQTLIYTVFKQPWQLPVAGLIVGYATNWIALWMIFNPQTPRRIGPFVWLGLFLKRQQEVARDYGSLIANEILTPGNIIEAILKGPQSDRLFELVQRQVQQAIDEELGLAKTFIPFTIGTQSYLEMKRSAVHRIADRLPQTLRAVEGYAMDAMNIRGTLIERLQSLPPDDFQDMLRPAFKEDEWMLIIVGAALGLLVGIGQMFLPGIG